MLYRVKPGTAIENLGRKYLAGEIVDLPDNLYQSYAAYLDLVKPNFDGDPEGVADLYLKLADNLPHTFTIGWHDRSVDIASISQANPAVITTTGNHCFATGDRVWLADTGTCPYLGGLQTATRISSTQFSVAFNVSQHGSTGMGKAFAPRDLTGYAFSGGIYKPAVTRQYKTTGALGSISAGQRHITLRGESPDFPFAPGDRIQIDGAVNDALVLAVGGIRQDYRNFVQDIYIDTTAAGSALDKGVGGYWDRLGSVGGELVSALSFSTVPLEGQIRVTTPALAQGCYFLEVDFEISLVKQALVRGQLEITG
jgi:hypothetical protein